ncbi:MAG: hypothetical protein Q7J14_00520, partial [Candidatus Magasanikbacteria bacterium]|nr:hypothetical protein [Candidatus Magasanikbacteria bacterium]
PNYCGDYKCQNCYNTSHKKPTAVQCCLDISDQTLYLTTTSPEIGYFYSEKTVWVEGVIKGSIVVGSNTDIVIKDNIVYSEKIEDNILGLVARENVLIPYKIRTDLEVNASMIAQDGAVQRYEYYQGESPYKVLDSIKVNGSVVSFLVWTFSWVDNYSVVINGFTNTETTFNTFSLFNPPPSSPVGADYAMIEWLELK